MKFGQVIKYNKSFFKNNITNITINITIFFLKNHAKDEAGRLV